MKPIFQKNLQFGDMWPRNRQKHAQIEVFGHFLDFASLVFLDFAHNNRWVWCLVVFLQFAGPVNVFLFKLKVLFLKSEKKTSIAIKTNVKISSLLPSISGQSRTSIRPIQIYVDINVSLLRFKYPVTLKKITRNVIVWTSFSTCNSMNCLIQKLEVYNFIVVVTLLNLSNSFRYSFLRLLYLLPCKEFLLFFSWLASF